MPKLLNPLNYQRYFSMGPRLEGHNSNIGISATDQTISGTSRIYQRKKEYSMDESSSSAFPSFAVQVEASPEETVDHNRFEFRILMASESQSSLASRDSCPSNVPQSRQSTISFLSEKRPRLLLAWSLHFASCILILFCGSRANQGKRFVKGIVNFIKSSGFLFTPFFVYFVRKENTFQSM